MTKFVTLFFASAYASEPKVDIFGLTTEDEIELFGGALQSEFPNMTLSEEFEILGELQEA